MKKLAGQMKKLSKKPPYVPYTRVKGVQTKFRKERCRYGVSIQSLMRQHACSAVAPEVDSGWRPAKVGWRYMSSLCNWSSGSFPVLSTEAGLGPSVLTQRLPKTNPATRLPSNFLWWTWCFHYSIRSPSSSAPPVTSAPVILDMDDKAVFRIYANLEAARARHAELKEKDIVFGKAGKWPDEADEVDLGKDLSEDGSSLTWEQWGGLVERGRANTLVLFRLQPSETNPRSPGPGPIRRREWLPIASKHLKDRQVVLHTDGAKAYKLKVPGVIHDNVVRKKKKILVNGKQRWVRPHYTKSYTHTLPNGKKIRVKAGAQVIDRFWGHVRAYLKHSPRRVGSCKLR